MAAITIRCCGLTSVADCEWTVAAVRRAVRADQGLKGPMSITLGKLAGVVGHVDENGDLTVVHVGRV